MKEQQNIQLVQECYAAYARGDLPYLLTCMTPDIDWELPAVPGLAFTGKRHGCDQVAEYFRLFDEQQTVRELVPKEFFANADKVIVLGHGAWTAKDTGRDFESDWVHVFTIQEGRIAAFREFMDVIVAQEAFQGNPLGTDTAASSPAPH